MSREFAGKRGVVGTAAGVIPASGDVDEGGISGSGKFGLSACAGAERSEPL